MQQDAHPIKRQGRICVAIAAKTVAEALAAARQAEQEADVVEIRLDALDHPQIKPFIEEIAKPVLFTNRPAWEGGAFNGAEKERVEFLLEAIRQGAAYVDLEMKAQKDLREQVLAAAKEYKTRVLLSWHNFTETPPVEALAEIFHEQRESGAHIGKIVTMAHGFTDVLRVLGLQVEAVKRDFPLIAFCMGRPGMISRLATVELNGYMTYAAPDTGAGTAPGQLTVSALRSMLENFT